MEHFLVIGDFHVVVNEIEECQRLADFIVDEVLPACPAGTRPLFLGDLYNNHASIRVEVLGFWHRLLDRLPDSVALVGNHDLPQSGADSRDHSLIPHLGQTYVVSEPVLQGVVGFLPYIKDPNDFVAAAQALRAQGARVLFCHQTFMGARYENGFYAPDGVPTHTLSGLEIISGHIHTPQIIGPVWYPGAPRWRSVSDADVQERHVHLVTIDPNSAEPYRVAKSWPTSGVCTPIRLLTVETEEQLAAASATPGARVTIKGSAEFVAAAEAKAASLGMSWRAVVEKEASEDSIRESDGISLAFKKFIDRADLPEGIRERVVSEIFKRVRL